MIGVWILVCFVPVVLGHGYVSNPLPRALTIPGHKFQYEPQSDAAQAENCQDDEKTGPIQAQYSVNSTINITTYITAFHNGWQELRFCPQMPDSLDCYQKYRATPIAANLSTQYEGKYLPNADDGGNYAVRGNFPEGDICGQSWWGTPQPTDHCFAHVVGSNFRFDSQWILPAGLTCDHCGMQWWWVTDNGGNENFKSCHDISIV